MYDSNFIKVFIIVLLNIDPCEKSSCGTALMYSANSYPKPQLTYKETGRKNIVRSMSCDVLTQQNTQQHHLFSIDSSTALNGSTIFPVSGIVDAYRTNSLNFLSPEHNFSNQIQCGSNRLVQSSSLQNLPDTSDIKTTGEGSTYVKIDRPASDNVEQLNESCVTKVSFAISNNQSNVIKVNIKITICKVH